MHMQLLSELYSFLAKVAGGYRAVYPGDPAAAMGFKSGTHSGLVQFSPVQDLVLSIALSSPKPCGKQL